MDFGSRAHTTAQNYASYRAQTGTGFTQFSSEPRSDGGGPGNYTPPLWKSTSPPSGISPRTRAIEQGQMELMEMVRNMPETCYELSLRDLVEKPAMSQDTGDPENGKALDRSESRKKVQNGRPSYKPQVARSGSINNGGLLIKMVFPGSSLGPKQKQRTGSSLAPNKVSPRPSLSDESARGLDKEWWKKFSASGEVKHRIMKADSGSVKSSDSSSSNGSNSGGNRRYVFFHVISLPVLVEL